MRKGIFEEVRRARLLRDAGGHVHMLFVREVQHMIASRLSKRRDFRRPLFKCSPIQTQETSLSGCITDHVVVGGQGGSGLIEHSIEWSSVRTTEIRVCFFVFSD